jgi:hypothetical protein
VLRGEWFLGLAVGIAVLLLLRLALRRPLLARWARPISATEAAVAAASLVLLVFHCSAMFAPETVARFSFLDGLAAVVRDLDDPVGQAAYWIPAIALVAGTRRLWWPAPAGLAIGLLAVGWTMYGDFTVTEHVVTIVVTGALIALVATGLIVRSTRTAEGPAG